MKSAVKHLAAFYAYFLFLSSKVALCIVPTVTPFDYPPLAYLISRPDRLKTKNPKIHHIFE